jgi:hypothetical protein
MVDYSRKRSTLLGYKMPDTLLRDTGRRYKSRRWVCKTTYNIHIFYSHTIQKFLDLVLD